MLQFRAIALSLGFTVLSSASTVWGNETSPAVRESNQPAEPVAYSRLLSLGSSSDQSKEALKTAAGIKSMGQAIRRTMRLCRELIKEVTERELEVVSDTTVIGPIIVSPEEPFSSEHGGNSYRPLRYNWISTVIGDIGESLVLLESEASETVIPEEKKARIASQWQNMLSEIENAREHYLRLKKMVDDHSLVRQTIVDEVKGLNKDLKEIDKQRKEIWKALKAKAK